MVDWDRVANLLNIVEKTSNVAPGFSYIISEAMAELRQIHNVIHKEHLRRQGQDVPAEVGDGVPVGTVSQEAVDSGQAVPNPAASKPLESPIEGGEEEPHNEHYHEPIPPEVEPVREEPISETDATFRRL